MAVWSKFWSGFTRVEIIAALIGAAAAILAAFAPSILKALKSRESVKIRRIRDPHDPYLDQALEVYRRIPENERDPEEDIVRWLAEVKAETDEGYSKLRDYFLVAVKRKKVAALVYAQLYPSSGFLFITAMAAQKEILEAGLSSPIRKLLAWLSAEMKRENCKGIVFELQRSDPISDIERTCRARMRHFRALARMLDVVPKEINIEYMQPRLSLWDDEQKEERQHLMYARAVPPHIGSEISRGELEKVLSFLYREIYGDQFEDDQVKDTEYRKYLAELKKRVMDGVPGASVPVS